MDQYSIRAYGRMIGDKRRTDAYIGALRQAVTPGAIVVDIGAGTGIFAMMACQFGAGHVYAIEPASAIEVAKQLAQDNGFADRITFIQDLSNNITLPQRAQVIISDLRGTLPLFDEHISSIIDARQRFLTADGVLIPCRDTLFGAPVEDANAYDRAVAPWDGNDFGLNWEAAAMLLRNSWLRSNNLKSDQLLAGGRSWATLDYETIEQSNVSGTLEWTVQRAGTLHGYSLWFEAQLDGEQAFSTAPYLSEQIYGNPFLPLLHPVEIDEGDQIVVHIGAWKVGQEYVWRWDTAIRSIDNTSLPKARFKQSTFDAIPLNMERMKKRGLDYVPRINDEGALINRAMALFDGQHTVSEIANLFAKENIDPSKSANDILEAVRDLSARFSQDKTSATDHSLPQ